METTEKSSLHCPDCGAPAVEDAVRCDFCHAVLSRAACPSCLGPMFLGMRFCPRCGAPAERKEVETGKPLPCPRCGVAMTTVDLAGARVRECEECGGLWVQESSFQKIVDDAETRGKAILYPEVGPPQEASPEDRSGRFYVPCPECGELMNRKNYAGISGVVLDVCRVHGLRFDRRELQDVADFVEKGGLEKSRKVELEELRQEQERLKAIQNAPAPGGVSDPDAGPSFLDALTASSVAGIVRTLLDRLL